MTRQSFRPRQLDRDRPMLIIRQPMQEQQNYNNTGVGSSQQEVYQEDQNDGKAKPSIPVQAKKASMIVTPMVREVPNYRRTTMPFYDYGHTYARGTNVTSVAGQTLGSAGNSATGVGVGVGVNGVPGYIPEYDMDDVDEAFLDKLNSDGVIRLSDTFFEYMIDKLEYANAAANEKAYAGYTQDAKYTPGIAAHVTLVEEAAIQELATCYKSGAGGSGINGGSNRWLLKKVYKFWKERRQRGGKPLVRQLQAPTPSTDQNPHNTFRPRERQHRPQTRRRRENNTDAFDKMKGAIQNINQALHIMNNTWTQVYEKKKMLTVLQVCSEQVRVCDCGVGGGASNLESCMAEMDGLIQGIVPAKFQDQSVPGSFQYTYPTERPTPPRGRQELKKDMEARLAKRAGGGGGVGTTFWTSWGRPRL